jgi:hypothetical protein
MSAVDSVTIARAHDPKVVMAKIVTVGSDGTIQGVKPSPHAFLWAFEEIQVDGLASLMQAVTEAARDPYSIAVRGAPLAPVGRRAIYRDETYGEHAEPGLRSVPRCWVGFDHDNIPLPRGDGWDYAPEIEDDPAEYHNWAPDPSCHPALHQPEIGVQRALARLPHAFRKASCGWQITGSAGFKPCFRLRTWHWLDHPTTGDEIKTWLKPALDRNLVDPVTLRECQEHYLGVKTVGGADPCPQRFGLWRGEVDTVAVPDIAGIRMRQEQAEREERRKREAGRSRCTTNVTGPELAQQRIAECINRLKVARDGTKHLVYVTQCAAAKHVCEEFKLDCWPQVRRDLAATYEASLPAGEADRRRRGSIEGVPNWLERRAG